MPHRDKQISQPISKIISAINKSQSKPLTQDNKNTNTTTSDLKTKFRIEKKHKISINHQINIRYYLKESTPSP
uniref:Uncharacterized protein n=1 Tax=Ralstonia syzygii R24 TaxID=907261 RepID=G3A5J0_9RALS|nr:hypothetical protein RALSY_30995 [Ralstonia syzygii R24]